MTSNIARPDICLWVVFGQECLFFQDSNEIAYLPEIKHIKACNSQDVKGWRTWLDSYLSEQKPNSRGNKWKISIL
ncbi:hypothetical protein I4641_08175 [Waterburya agarophytonicola K14]|uniref:Uncharacterized protein n=1 Tax=Waterburya agarophytonicola KI4 TaxID=2874699 RepID=A0A964BPD0_9CYAN|nr:hypothetical protein [Waterburya agarophytonicola]MCC0176955.1 hypothetical protein [Waterburya agarophytonicola KI4]